jgi:predicted branched-subunit amino acid permease
MGVSLSQKFSPGIKMVDRFLISFVNTDEVFAVSSGKESLVGRKYLYGLILTPYLGWSFGTFLGAAAGDILPSFITSALGLAIFGMFVAIVVPDARKSRPIALCAVCSAALSCLFRYTPVLSGVPSGFVIIICAVSVSAVFALLFPIKTENDAQEEVK